ncbi:hypothetical protein [Kitasatospora kifunensis]|uniref:Uncharacterized protein n=1 Tax=Kitasatospora kifunensis TaxID=58351 RepID=A0A7W7QX64_KITKI|nr:hypothetical protein [Kitasatospora kifunensis]MBB4921188.1 hypothetical protein [Kitasatospora kifunensis]
MGDIVPIVFFLGLVALVLGAPRFGPFQERRRAATTARELTVRHDFAPSPTSALGQLPLAGPPFHYGSAHRLTDQVSGTLGALPVSAATYTCRENGSTHVYGVVLVAMPHPLAPVEVRHEPVFHSVRVIEPMPEGLARTGEAAFEGRYRAYTSDPHAALTVFSAEGARELLAAPEPCSWRTEGSDLLLWRAGGWSSAQALLGCVSVVASVLGAVDQVAAD